MSYNKAKLAVVAVVTVAAMIAYKIFWDKKHSAGEEKQSPNDSNLGWN